MVPRKSKTAAKGKAKKKATKVSTSSRRRTKKPKETAAAIARRLAKERAAKEAEKEAAREEELRKRRKQAEKVEKPTQPMDDLLVLPKTQTASRKRPANAAYDDRGKNKRVRFAASDSDDENGPPAFPWDKNKKLERPPSPSFDLGREFAKMKLNPIDAMGDLGKLPTEVRDEILRYILIADGDIRVFRGWSLAYPRKKAGLDLAILCTCNVLRLQGLRILFGENTFFYDIRDPSDHLPHTYKVLNNVYDKCVVPIAKYGHLIRYIKIFISSNRLTPDNADNFAKAIYKFVPDGGLFEPANLHTLTLEFPVVTERNLRRGGSLQVWDFFSPNVRDALSQLNVQFIRVIAKMPDKDARGPYEYVVDLRCFYKQRQTGDGETKTMTKAKAKELEHTTKRLEALVEKSKARLYNIPTRLFEITAYGPEVANEKKVYWTELEKPQEPTVQLQSLPNNWRDRATSGRSGYTSARRRLANLTTQPSKHAATRAWLEGIEGES
ncbi:hypothetical protein GGR53DRAFT_243068 [Hypoxylon sp. FL1150]|nr:hypothetical protein GGR53DRAFT_243068 [Hypoxylon sp. FL1150]